MDDVKQFLEQQERYDLLAILNTYIDENEDYSPPLYVKEPIEEYIEEGEPEDVDVGITKDGFYFLK